LQRVDADLAAEHRLVEAHLEIAADRVALDAEARMADELDRDQRVAGLAAERVGAALALEADDLARTRAGWNGDLDGAPGGKVDASFLAERELLESDRGGGSDVLPARLLGPACAG